MSPVDERSQLKDYFRFELLDLTRRQDNPTHGEVSIDPLDNRPRVLPAESVIDLIAVPDKAGGAAAKAR